MGVIAAPASADPGDLDPSFSHDGIAYPGKAPGSPSLVEAQSSGLIVVAGSGGSPESRHLVVRRLSTDGSKDTSFGDAGAYRNERCRPARGLTESSDGDLFIVSSTCLVKLDASGAPDLAFAESGVAQVRRADDVAVDVEGRILVSGSPERTAAVKRFTSAGARDLEFGTEGKVLIEAFEDPLGRSPSELAVADGSYFVVGNVGANPGIASLNEEGDLVPDFGSEGIAVFDTDRTFGYGEDLEIDQDGSLVLAGFEHFAGIPGDENGFVARFDAGGEPDPDFGTSGVYRLRPLSENHVRFSSVEVGPDGDIFAAGTFGQACAFSDPECVEESRASLVKLSGAGQLVPGFGDGGVSLTSLGGLDEYSDLDLLDDGRLVAGGFSRISDSAEGRAAVAVHFSGLAE